jgi:segregation and condensation protein B
MGVENNSIEETSAQEEDLLIADDTDKPALVEIISAILFVAKTPYTAADIRRIFAKVNEQADDTTPKVAAPKEAEIHATIQQIKTIFVQNNLGFEIAEVAGGYRLQTSPAAGYWVRQVLNIGKPHHLSKPALETLAIIAYRQPITRAEIEAVRGVNVDAIVRSLLEAQLIRIVGRSDLPGKPLLYGTTKLFLEHLGINTVENLPGIEQLRRKENETIHREEAEAIAKMRNEEETNTSCAAPDEEKSKAEAQEEAEALQEELKKETSQENQNEEKLTEDDEEISTQNDTEDEVKQ